eukprot:tig00020912_g15853.t1
MPEEPAEIARRLLLETQRRLLGGRQPSQGANSKISNAAAIAAGIVPCAIYLLRFDDKPNLQVEAARWISVLTNTSFEATRAVAHVQGIPPLVRLLRSPHEKVRLQALWALGGITGDLPAHRDDVLRAGALAPICDLAAVLASPHTSVRAAAWVLSNICRNRPKPPLSSIRDAVPTLVQLLSCADVEVLSDACWALHEVATDASSDAPATHDALQAIAEASACAPLARLLSHLAMAVREPALKTLATICTGTNELAQAVLDGGALPGLLACLESGDASLRREATWAASNIAAGTRPQVKALIAAGFLPALVSLLRRPDECPDDAAWAICNAVRGGGPHAMRAAAEAGCIKPLVDLLSPVREPHLLAAIVAALDAFVRGGEASGLPGSNPYAALLRKAGAPERLEGLASGAAGASLAAAATELRARLASWRDRKREARRGSGGSGAGAGAGGRDCTPTPPSAGQRGPYVSFLLGSGPQPSAASAGSPSPPPKPAVPRELVLEAPGHCDITSADAETAACRGWAAVSAPAPVVLGPSNSVNNLNNRGRP